MHLSFNDIKKAHSRIKDHVVKTPLLTNQILNKKLGADVYFKCENFQTTGSFKFRGVVNKMLKFKEDNGFFPEKVVAVSSGNHAHAVAYVAQKFGVKALIFMEKKVSPYKVAATRSYGAEVVLTETKKETEIFAEEKIKEGYVYFHSSNDEDIVCGQGTSPLEAIDEAGEFDAIFAPCGGGGLVASAYLAGQIQKNKPKVYAVEPLMANDAAITYRTGKLFTFEHSQNSIADGVRTLKISDHNIPYLFKLDGVYEIEEENIIKWTQVASSRLKIFLEPTGALSIGAAEKYLNENKDNATPSFADANSIPLNKGNGKRQKILVVLSGGNMSQETAQQIWKEDYLIKMIK